MTSQVCCDHDRLCDDAAQLEELAADPTLASCCQRDAYEQAVVAKLKAALTLVDRSRHREHLRAAVFGAGEEEPASSGCNLETSDDEELDALRAARLRQLQMAAKDMQLKQESGHGTLQTASLQELQTLWRRCETPVVAQVSAEGSATCDEAAEVLAVLAHHHPHMRFVRVVASRRQEHSLPAIFGGNIAALAWRNEGVTGPLLSLPVEDEDVAEVEPLVHAWFKTLLKGAGPGRALPAAPKGESDSEEESEEEEGAEPCAQCGRQYPHQHIRSVMAHAAADSEDEDSS